MADTISLKLLRGGPLLMDVLPLAVPKRGVHFLGVAGIDDLDPGDINARVVACVSEHRHRLTTVMHKHFRTFQRCPAEIRVMIAASDEKSIHVVDQREMSGCGRITLFQSRESLADGRLHDLCRPVCQRFQGRHPWFGNAPLDIKPLFVQKVSSHGGNQGGIER